MLWVKRARQEHDAFADVLRDRGVEVLYLHDLLAETLADDVGAQVGARAHRHRARARADAGPHVRDHLEALDPARSSPRSLIGGCHRRASSPARRAGLALRHARPDRSRARRRCRTTCSPATPRAGSTAASRSTPWPSPRGGARPCISRRSTASTRRSRASSSNSGTAGSTKTGAAATIEGGDVLVIGNGAVLIGMGERTTP